jgi:hypothetical protein
MDKFENIKNKVKDTFIKGSEVSNKIISILVPYIVLVILINIYFNQIIAKIDYSTWIDWWNTTGGNNYKETFDIYSMAYFSHSTLLFDIQQLFQPGPVKLDYTEIMLLQSIVLTNANVIKTHGSTRPNNFVTPKHICEGICWNDNDIDIFREGIDSYYSNPNVQWYPKWVAQGKPGPDNGTAWTAIMGFPVSGFWPHQNGCYGFFDIPGGVGNPYDLDTSFPVSFGLKNQDSKVYIYYIPGSATVQGSWAQLFADFGIAYSTNQSDGKGGFITTKVPVIASTSNQDNWYISGYNENKYGPNFMGVYKINPSSFLLTSWVSNLYNDPTTGQKLDPQAFKNLIGMQPGALKASRGGWIKFFKGINTELSSYDQIMNDLFAVYATNYTVLPKKQCKPSSAFFDAVNTGLSIGSMGLFLGPVGGGVMAVAGVGMGIWKYFNAKSEQNC